jgi:hypothetical protein
MRSYAWIELANTAEHPKSDWIKNTLVPDLEKITGIKWSLQKRLIYSEEVSILEDIKSNQIIKDITKKWTTCKLEDFGYKIKDKETERFIKHSAWTDKLPNYESYIGFWALDPENIINRGQILGKKFGL